MSVMHYLLYFLIAISILIAVHEFGHYLAARLCGIKVLTFSLGFGPRIFSKCFGSDSTEFVLSAFPLGGFVRMLDEREGGVRPEEKARAFNTQSTGKRSIVVLAGPLANLILAVFLYWFIGCIGEDVLPPKIGDIKPGTISAQAGFQPGDKITAINGDPVYSWSEFRMGFIQKSLDGGLLNFSVLRGEDQVLTLDLEVEPFNLDRSSTDPVSEAGFFLPILPIKPILSAPLPDSPAMRAGFLPGDLVLSVDSQQIPDWHAFVESITNSEGKILVVIVARNSQIVELKVRPELSSERLQKWRIGVAPLLTEDVRKGGVVKLRFGPLDALSQALRQTYGSVDLTCRLMWKILSGKASFRNISGPVTIADFAGQSANAGLVPYLRFLALVSISIAILNLLPVPILDGGHLMYYALEWVTGKPLSEDAQLAGQRLGMVLLMLLMVLAFFNDINRIFFG